MPHDITRGQIGELETVRKPLVELFGIHFEIAALLSVSAVSFQLSGGFFWGGGGLSNLSSTWMLGVFSFNCEVMAIYYCIVQFSDCHCI